jgi:Receptor L domain
MVRESFFAGILFLGTGCLTPVVEGPDLGPVPSDGGVAEVTCGDGGTYGVRSNGLKFFEGCTRIRGRLNIDSENSLEPYLKITVVDRELWLSYLIETRDLEPLKSVSSVGGLLVHRAPLLTTLEGLEGLRTVGSLGGVVILQNEKLVSLSVLGPSRIAGGPLVISNNRALANLDGLQSVTTLAELKVTGNDALSDLSGLSNLQRVEGDVTFFASPRLSRAEVERFVARLQVGGTVRISP